MAMLYDFYGDLLTARQKEFYDLYYNDDLSLAEIAENYEITRQGVRDIIVRAEKTLEDIEEKTGLIRRFHQTRATVSILRELTSQIEDINRERLKDAELEKLLTQLSEAMEDLEKE
jgi:predicted DNA-binding protein YlxM (UPF0122 family)